LTTFLDTSALLALLDEDDLNHSRADEAWRQLLGSDEPLVSTNYIVVETLALVQRRLGMEAAKALERDLLPLLDLEWINEATHRSALRTFLTASRRQLSFVDCSSFEVMRKRGVSRAFAFDQHFGEQGFELIAP
jgi:predicted nucleic acid-binding protein